MASSSKRTMPRSSSQVPISNTPSLAPRTSSVRSGPTVAPTESTQTESCTGGDSRVKQFAIGAAVYEEAVKSSVKRFANITNAGVSYLYGLEHEARKMEESRDAMSTEENALQKRVGDLRDAIARLQQSWQMMHQNNCEAEKRNRELGKNYHALRAAYGDLRRKHDNMQSALKDLKDPVQLWESKKGYARSSADRKSRR